jgi:hypothetical protein
MARVRFWPSPSLARSSHTLCTSPPGYSPRSPTASPLLLPAGRRSVLVPPLTKATQPASPPPELLPAPWYVANVSIIFDAPCSFYTNCFMFCLHFVVFYEFSRTNLLTRCDSASSYFLLFLYFRKVIQVIFSELDEIKAKVPIYLTRRWSPKERRSRARRRPHHRVARPHP